MRLYNHPVNLKCIAEIHSNASVQSSCEFKMLRGDAWQCVSANSNNYFKSSFTVFITFSSVTLVLGAKNVAIRPSLSIKNF